MGRKSAAGAAIALVALATLLALVVPARADGQLATRLSVSVERNADDDLRPRVSVTLVDAEGNAVRDRRAEGSQGRVTLHNAGRATSTVYLGGQTGVTTTTTRLAAGGTYDVYASYAGGTYDGTTYLAFESAHVTVSVAEATPPTAVATPADQGSSNGSIALSGGGPYQYAEVGSPSASDWHDVGGATLAGLAPGTYHVRSASSFVASPGAVSVLLASKPVEVEVGELAPVYHRVTLVQAEHARWSGNGASDTISVREGTGTASPYLSAEPGWYVTGVDVSPAGAARAELGDTGEVFVSDVRGDVSLVPRVARLVRPASLEVVGWQVAPVSKTASQNVTDAAGITYTVLVSDDQGDPVPQAKVSFSLAGVSGGTYASYARTTGLDGRASFVVHPQQGDYVATFSLEGDASVTASQPLHVLAQDRPAVDVANARNESARGAHDGAVWGLPAGAEWFTYPTRNPNAYDQDVLTYELGEWLPVEDGRVDGLDAGVYAVRLAQRSDEASHSVWLFSPWSTFRVDTADLTVTADVAASGHVSFAETAVTVAHNGDARFHVSVDEGYELLPSGIALDHPGYAETSWDPETGVLSVSGVTRGVKVRATATPVAASPASGVAESGEGTPGDPPGSDPAAQPPASPVAAPAPVAPRGAEPPQGAGAAAASPRPAAAAGLPRTADDSVAPAPLAALGGSLAGVGLGVSLAMAGRVRRGRGPRAL